MTKVFLSYNRKDTAFVTLFAEKLTSQHTIPIDLFFDKNVQGGENWPDVVEKALRESDACIVFISEHGIGEWQNRELITATRKYHESSGEFKVIPVIVPYGNREQVKKDFPWILADMQWIEFSNETDQDAFLQLLNSLKGNPYPDWSKLIATGNTSFGLSPYKGLDFFDIADAPYFFGRTFDLNWIFYKKIRLQSVICLKILACSSARRMQRTKFYNERLLGSFLRN